ncbi:hypothetical protein KFK09_010219 [Dendrobium nobile]|uniref:Uncharacterized protein n=1 Tax=Dendrobium nobile TaxID=94219 RepID=A0A8T3BJF5_DENNO|nr:hypothetical protein KFK09_010219 [Dendrobium nobile]
MVFSAKHLPLVKFFFIIIFLMQVFNSESTRTLVSLEASASPKCSSSTKMKLSCSRKSYQIDCCMYMANETPPSNAGHSPSIGHNLPPELLI